MKDKGLYSIAEVAKIMGISRIAVYKKVKKGEIEAERIGRSYAIRAKALDYILGHALRESEAREIDNAVKRVVDEYGEVLEKLGQE